MVRTGTGHGVPNQSGSPLPPSRRRGFLGFLLGGYLGVLAGLFPRKPPVYDHSLVIDPGLVARLNEGYRSKVPLEVWIGEPGYVVRRCHFEPDGTRVLDEVELVDVGTGVRVGILG